MKQRPIYDIDIRIWIAVVMVVVGTGMILWFSLDFDLTTQLAVVGGGTLLLAAILIWFVLTRELEL